MGGTGAGKSSRLVSPRTVNRKGRDRGGTVSSGSLLYILSCGADSGRLSLRDSLAGGILRRALDGRSLCSWRAAEEMRRGGLRCLNLRSWASDSLLVRPRSSTHASSSCAASDAAFSAAAIPSSDSAYSAAAICALRSRYSSTKGDRRCGGFPIAEPRPGRSGEEAVNGELPPVGSMDCAPSSLLVLVGFSGRRTPSHLSSYMSRNAEYSSMRASVSRQAVEYF
eukprot:scaffold228540_cov36-Tisochrysis_lutea.AAC.2